MRIVVAFFGWFLLTMGTAFGQQVPAAVPDEIFHNGKIITVDSAFSIQEAFAVKGEWVFAVGSNAAMRALTGPNTRLTDLRGHAVIPGLMDNHDHLYNAALLDYWGVDLDGVKSIGEMLSRLRQAVASARPGEAVATTDNWTENSLQERRGPTRQELDQVAADRTLVVMRARGTAYLNSFALRAAGIT